jgi:hypothetical protein
LGELEQAIGELGAALAIKRWADDSSASYRLRGLRPVDRLVGEPTVDVVLDALRALIGPPRSAVMPSPFGRRRSSRRSSPRRRIPTRPN